jgi:hypothetical protein
VALCASGPSRLGIKSETYNVLALRYLDCVEFNIVMIVSFKLLMKLTLIENPPFFYYVFNLQL